MEQRQVRAKPEELSVCIGLPCGATLPWQTALSLAATVRACALKGIPVEVAVIAGAAIVTEARNQVVHAYLKTDCSRLFLIDSDMAWREDDFLRMLVLSEIMPVLCASYPRKRPDLRHTIKPLEGIEAPPNEFNCRQISGTGLGFTVMRREVVEAVVAAAGSAYDEVQAEEIPDVFRVDTVERRGRRTRRGEDMAFFADVMQAGYPIWYDPSVKLGHVGMHVFGGAA